jgi:hypothetical protein
MLHGVGAFTESVESQQWRRQLAVCLDGLRLSRTVTPLPLEPLTDDELERICGLRT